MERATFDLEGRYELVLSLSHGRLEAAWTSFRLRFPGPFDPDKWGTVLAQMAVLANWLETRDSSG